MVNQSHRGIGDRFIPASRLLNLVLSPEKGLKTYALQLQKAKELLKKSRLCLYDKNELLDVAGNPRNYNSDHAENALRGKWSLKSNKIRQNWNGSLAQSIGFWGLD
jgi:hypothetical protein